MMGLFQRAQLPELCPTPSLPELIQSVVIAKFSSREEEGPFITRKASCTGRISERSSVSMSMRGRSSSDACPSTSITGYNGPTCPSSSNGKYDDANAAAHAEPPHECRANH
ncbi:hypothetical protein HBI55_127390 [Parastagonospora nodorum]|nr:hypothetical protein HBI72_061720 [Parastagonospora nodorum]KAH5656920.1 hypothetical protein HBI51_032870 [Parastagonospora nodorum]KAH5766594.1 hypothetical protein HBI17_032340 [Parastagonospora nodorum]KAH6223332.1 hypothetical protein HBI53_068160 [Parastagonospora nodorum]KAH6422508.1 hypothetical protein HBI14_075560 [Parastagonospora nodorum]